MYVSTAARITIQKSRRWPAFDHKQGGVRLFGYATDVWVEGCGMPCWLLYRTAGNAAPQGTAVFVKGSLSFTYPNLLIGSTYIQHAPPHIRDLSPRTVPYVYVSGRLTGDVRAFGQGDDSRVTFVIELHSPTPGAIRCTCRRASRLIAELPRLYEQNFAAIVGTLGEQPGTMLNVTVMQFACLIYPEHVVERDAAVIWPGPAGEEDRRVVGYYLPVNNDVEPLATTQIAATAKGEPDTTTPLLSENDDRGVGQFDPVDMIGGNPLRTPGHSSVAPRAVAFDASGSPQAHVWTNTRTALVPDDVQDAALAGLANAPSLTDPPAVWDHLQQPGPGALLDPSSSSLYGALGPGNELMRQTPVAIDPRLTLLPPSTPAAPQADVAMDVETQQFQDVGPCGDLPIVPTVSPPSLPPIWGPLASDANALLVDPLNNYALTPYAAGASLSSGGVDSVAGLQDPQLWAAGENMDVGQGGGIPPQNVSAGSPSSTGVASTSAVTLDDLAEPQVPEVLYSGPEDFPRPNATQHASAGIPLSPMASLMAGTTEQYNWTSDEYDVRDFDMAPEEAFDVYLHDG